MATGSFRGLGWIASFAILAPCFYMVSSMVAAERGRVEAVERAILAARKDLRQLETEFGTRANHDQLERWNGDVLALSAPRPDQYLADEAALASLGSGAVPAVPGGVTDTRMAAMVVPSGVPEGVMAAAAPAEPVATVRPAVITRIVEEVAPVAAAPRAQKVAMIERRPISDAVMGDLMRGARAETSER